MGKLKLGETVALRMTLRVGVGCPAYAISFLCTVSLTGHSGCQVRYRSACAQVDRWWNVADCPRVFPRVRVWYGGLTEFSESASVLSPVSLSGGTINKPTLPWAAELSSVAWENQMCLGGFLTEPRLHVCMLYLQGQTLSGVY